MPEPEETRKNEWFVPRVGPPRLRLLVGLTFYPYTLMNASLVLVGSLLAPSVSYDRMLGLALVYIVAVGVSAHSLDALAPSRPWGEFLTRRQLLALATGGLAFSVGLGLYYALLFAPLLIPVGVLEVFFLLSYNLELFGGFFHTDFWFALSWGFLPVVAGYVLQGDAPGAACLAGGLFGLSTAYVEISASRPYKAMKRHPTASDPELARRLERVLKAVVASVMSTALFLLAFRLA